MACYGYHASKAAVIHLVRAAALELAPHGILVNAICPGPFYGTLIGGGVTETPTEEMKQMWETLIPLGRMAHPDELKASSCSSRHLPRASSRAPRTSSTAAPSCRHDLVTAGDLGSRHERSDRPTRRPGRRSLDTSGRRARALRDRPLPLGGSSGAGLSFADYDELWRWSVSDLEGFWSSVWEFFECPLARAVRAGARLERRCPGRAGSPARG